MYSTNPPIPTDIVDCLRKQVPAPKEGDWDVKYTSELLAKLRTNDVKKTLCGERLMQIYNKANDQTRAAAEKRAAELGIK